MKQRIDNATSEVSFRWWEHFFPLRALVSTTAPTVVDFSVPVHSVRHGAAEMLRRTEEKRETRVKERLDDYNRRNFKDYFDVVDKGYNGKVPTENDEAIRAQLRKWNGDK